MKQKVALGFVLTALLPSAQAEDISLSTALDDARSGYYEQAARMFGPLAKQGSGVAQFNLGLMYHSGMGVGHDEAEAVRLYHQAAANGEMMAQQYLAVGYAEGWFGLKKDAEKAHFWESRWEAQVDTSSELTDSAKK